VEPSRLVTIGSFANFEEAKLAQAALAEEEIRAFLEGANMAGMLWYLSNAMLGIKLQVAVDDVEQAKAVLGHATAGDEEQRSAATPRRCGKCGAEMEPGFDACWSCGAMFEAAPGPTSAVRQALPVEKADEDAEPPTAEGDALADRAWRAAVLGLFICPPLLSIYSAWVLLRIAFSDRPLSGVGRRHFCWAAAADLLASAVVGLFLVRIGLSR
jgi:hypothetical protein